MLNLKNIKTVEDCDKLILIYLQETYKEYLTKNFRQAKIYIRYVDTLINKSKQIQSIKPKKKIKKEISDE